MKENRAFQTVCDVRPLALNQTLCLYYKHINIHTGAFRNCYHTGRVTYWPANYDTGDLWPHDNNLLTVVMKSNHESLKLIFDLYLKYLQSKFDRKNILTLTDFYLKTKSLNYGPVDPRTASTRLHWGELLVLNVGGTAPLLGLWTFVGWTEIRECYEEN